MKCAFVFGAHRTALVHVHVLVYLEVYAAQKNGANIVYNVDLISSCNEFVISNSTFTCVRTFLRSRRSENFHVQRYGHAGRSIAHAVF